MASIAEESLASGCQSQITVDRCHSGTDSVVSVSSVQPAQAVTTPTVHGAWQLLSYNVEEQSKGETFAPMVVNPSGYVIFTVEGRLTFMPSAERRQPGSNAEE